ncbi:MAG: sigma-70 family RNA polymerase sigma factor [Chloroflexi bacterium]|nr:sigma-70 family RNA polymerase sigma factor [Chloroflexota bacterium]
MCEMLELWRVAEPIALRACREALASLQRGDGGFYTVDDFRQDLYVQFWLLVQRTPREDLWRAWRSHLAYGGRNVLRLAPQRLWARREVTLPADVLALDALPADRIHARLGSRAREQLASEDAAHMMERLAAIEELEASLSRLRPSERQVLYLLALRGLPAEEVARRLRISSANAVHQRVSRARERLAQLMHRPRKGKQNRKRRMG